MIAGRSATQKSGYALFWVAQMNLPSLYFSADMSPFTASSRLASMVTGDTAEMVEAGMKEGGKYLDRYLNALKTGAGSNITFSFGSPISWQTVDEEMEAYIEIHDEYPQVIVFDNLMDFDGAESDYTEQMAVMSNATELARHTKARDNNRLEIGGIVLTMYDPALELANEVASEVRGYFEDAVFDSMIPRDVQISESPSHGLSVLEYAPRARGSRAYAELVMEVLDRE